MEFFLKLVNNDRIPLANKCGKGKKAPETVHIRMNLPCQAKTRRILN